MNGNRTVSIFKNGSNRAIRIPKDLDFPGVNELEISRERNSIILRSAKPNWISLQAEEKADDDFLLERIDVVEEGRGIL